MLCIGPLITSEVNYVIGITDKTASLSYAQTGLNRYGYFATNQLKMHRALWPVIRSYLDYSYYS